MTQLFIDNQEVVLPSNLSVDLIVSNPLLTKEGTTTYDIDIDLRNQQNARIYRHINRINTTEHPKSRTAVFMVDGHTILKGTEIILKINGDKAKIQIVGGNSEFNYNNKDTRLRDLDLGHITPAQGDEITPQEAYLTLSQQYPQANHVFTPVLTLYKYAPYIFWNTKGRRYDKFLNTMMCVYKDQPLRYADTPRFAPQPYLLYYVRTVLEQLGYRVDLDILLQQQEYKRLYVVNSVRTLDYAKMIPNWTVEKFVEEVEKFFNVVITVDGTGENIKVVHQRTYYQQSGKYYISDDDIIDEFEREFDQNDNSYANQYDNVKYNFPSTDLYKYWSLDDELIRRCKVFKGNNVDFKSWVIDECTYIQHRMSQQTPEKDYNLLIIFHTYDAEKQIISRAGNGGKNGYVYFPILVDQFHPVVDEDSKNTTTMSIVPAEVVGMGIHTYFNGTDGNAHSNYFYATIPYCRTKDSATTLGDEELTDEDEEEEAEIEKDRGDGTTENNGLNEYILGGIPQEQVSEQIFVAFYNGILTCLPVYDNLPGAQDPNIDNIIYPHSTVYPRVNAHLIGSVPAETTRCLQFPQQYDLSPAYRKQNFYDTGLQFDESTEFTIMFRAKQLLDPTRIFIIRNRAFYCKQLKYQVEAKGLNTIVEGIFHPVQ